MVTYTSLPSKAVESNPSYFYSESSAGAVRKTAASAYALKAHMRGHLYGMTLSNNATDATNDIDIAAGSCVDSTGTDVMTLSASITKQLDNAWAVGTNLGGLDAGTIANTTYHVYVIKRPDTGVVDVIFSTSASSPTLPTNYTLYRRIGSIIRSAGAILAFVQDGDLFLYSTPINEVAATNPGTSAVTRNMTVPQGITVFPIMAWSVKNDTTAQITCYISPLILPDNAPSVAFSTFRTDAVGAGGSTIVQHVVTNTSGQVRSRLSASGASDVLRCALLGWRDNRGRT